MAKQEELAESRAVDAVETLTPDLQPEKDLLIATYYISARTASLRLLPPLTSGETPLLHTTPARPSFGSFCVGDGRAGLAG
jgi:hypothetical protein